LIVKNSREKLIVLWHVWGRRETHIDFGLENLKEKKNCLEDLPAKQEVYIKIDLKSIAWLELM